MLVDVEPDCVVRSEDLIESSCVALEPCCFCPCSQNRRISCRHQRGAMHTAASLSALVLIFAAYAQAASCYRTLVAFGASYNGERRSQHCGPSTLTEYPIAITDNAHPRDPQYADSLRNYAPYEAFEGRYTNGPVAVEYMAMKDTEPGLGCDDEAVELLDCESQ